jgi:thiol:disulfide interchange protein DsbC
MKLLTTLCTTALALVLALPAAAQDLDRIRAEIKKRFPEAQIDSARKTPYGGLIELTGGGDVYYTDENATFLLLGHLIDVKTGTNVTEARLRKISAIDFGTLPLDNAVKVVRGNGSRRIAIFADPNCGYCKRFERETANVTDLTMYVFLYPILSPDSTVKSKAIWCADDRAKAWQDLMLKGAAPAGGKDCKTPIDQVLAFGHEKRISGTPTIFFEDGQRVPGAMSVVAFEKRLAEAAVAKKP